MTGPWAESGEDAGARRVPYWVRQTASARALLAGLWLGCSVMSVGVVNGPAWGVIFLFGYVVVMCVMALGTGVRVDREGLVVRNLLTQRRILHERVLGVISETDLSIVVPAGMNYSTQLRQTLIQPSDTRMYYLRRALARPGSPMLPLLERSDLNAMWRPNNPDLAPDVLEPERWHFYRPAWWQLAMLAVWCLAVVLANLPT